MAKIIQQYETGKFRAWNPSMPVVTMQDTVSVHYGDSRAPRVINVAELGEQPYPVARQLTSVKGWTAEELAAHYLYTVADFEPPDGHRAVGEPRYEPDSKNRLTEVYDVEPLPEKPAPAPVESKSPLQRLAEAAGLSEDEVAGAVLEAGELASRKERGEIVAPKL